MVLIVHQHSTVFAQTRYAFAHLQKPFLGGSAFGVCGFDVAASAWIQYSPDSRIRRTA